MTQRIHVPPNGGIPNHPRWAALVVPGAAPVSLDAAGAKRLVREHGWGGEWDWTVYDFHHFHPDAHEALLCIAGRASLKIGGEEGEEIDIRPGDGLILPAGTGHKLLSSGDGFRVVGCYPPGQEEPQIIREDEATPGQYDAQIAALAAPETDPFTGKPFTGWE
ncbi:cupin domain-containing protein [Pseudoroseicyclus sp. H15]